MKLRALQHITDYQGSVKGFGEKNQGEIFEVAQDRAEQIIALGGAEEVKEEIQEIKAKK